MTERFQELTHCIELFLREAAERGSKDQPLACDCLDAQLQVIHEVWSQRPVAASPLPG